MEGGVEVVDEKGREEADGCWWRGARRKNWSQEVACKVRVSGAEIHWQSKCQWVGLKRATSLDSQSSWSHSSASEDYLITLMFSTVSDWIGLFIAS